MRRGVSALLVLVFLGPASVVRASPPPAADASNFSDCQRALHVLNRLGFGPAPGDVDRVLELGIGNFIEIQLHPESLPDPVAAAKLDSFPILRMNEAELMESFEKPVRNARRVAEKEYGKPGEGNEEAAKAIERTIDELVSPAVRPQRVLDELTAARVLRATYSQAQLNEILVDFWMNHFNVFAGKDTDRILVASFERDVIRPHIWGCFRDLLLATAKSPAMLVYLDNSQSVAELAHRPGVTPKMIAAAASSGKPQAGLNENYARELLELHTLGVDGGYTQKDVTELARVLTGWSVAPPEEGGGFLFKARLHDVAPKEVLGHPISEGGGLQEGEEIIDQLSRHPSTARHIAYRLCQRFVADDPPRDLVERVANVFLLTDGDLREVVRSIVTSPEFFEPRFYRAKVKTPFEYVVSAVRALGAGTDGVGLARQITVQGEPLYLCAPPTGYSNVSSAWVNTGAMLARWNFAVNLSANKIPGTEVDLSRLLPRRDLRDAGHSFSDLADLLLAGDVSAGTLRTLEECLLPIDPGGGKESLDPRIPLIAGSLVASPDFQRK
jgi:uncharacterized protein (DUF1800 family)